MLDCMIGAMFVQLHSNLAAADLDEGKCSRRTSTYDSLFIREICSSYLGNESRPTVS